MHLLEVVACSVFMFAGVGAAFAAEDAATVVQVRKLVSFVPPAVNNPPAR